MGARLPCSSTCKSHTTRSVLSNERSGVQRCETMITLWHAKDKSSSAPNHSCAAAAGFALPACTDASAGGTARCELPLPVEPDLHAARLVAAAR
eukprot:scaffold224468_cov31-Tisochrysis_lutea.AAC.1